MTLNFRYGGRADARGRPDDRWGDLVEIIRKVEPDLLLGQEAHGWAVDPRLQADAEDDVGLRAHVAPSRSGAHTVVMHRTSTLRWRQWETKYAHDTHHGFGVAVLDVLADPEVQVPLTAISAHLNPYSVLAAAQEAQLLAARLYRYGGMGVIGGDINHLPPGDPEPDWESVPPYNRSSRCQRRYLPDQEWCADREVGFTLADAGLLDVAALIATRQPAPGTAEELLVPTGHHGGVRTDQIWVTDNMTEAVCDYRRVGTGQASDHDATLTTIQTTALHHVEAREWT
ncbi:endonuclease/exonuclease/phosphatase family protein [Actinomadura sp. KC06]|uniref:endonuclease/exonuclease/phosphatase family protein n=1 Tax=Actinomadura sp. KC06 TaxID=2530369 RepID=UPI00104ED5E4|nr:endonuclease/exonuclease/phosphatase family protein [Actinomadura sp. KC06]TDD31206.1 endonuclease/exonuclease/phosphatase family protein [Actinomadura sp. KC06]